MVNNLCRQVPLQPVRVKSLNCYKKYRTMLVLSRQRDESIMIGDNIVVTVVDVRGDKVRLGIDAPSEIPVHRQEVYDAIQRENRRATQVRPKDARKLRGSTRPSRKSD